jgi:hypothetical protein
MTLPGQQAVSKFIVSNASTILTGMGVVGTVTTAVLTAKASFKAAEMITEGSMKKMEKATSLQSEIGLTTQEKIKLVWPLYIPPVLSGVATVSCIVMSNRISASRAAALAAAYAASENRLKEYREKVQEKLTGPKAQAIEDSIAQDRVTADPPGNLTVIEGEVLMKDMLTGRYFHSTVEKIRQGERAIRDEMHMTGYASLSEFYDKIGLEKTSFTDLVGWNTLGSDGELEVKMTTAMTPDGRPCVVIDFNNIPRPDAHKLY